MKTHSPRDRWARALDPLGAEQGPGAGAVPLLSVKSPSLELWESPMSVEHTGVRTKYCPLDAVGHHVGPLLSRQAEGTHEESEEKAFPV